MQDFIHALDLVKPAFGVSTNLLENAVRGGYYVYGKQMREVHQYCSDLIKSLKNSNKTQLLSLLLSGVNGCGKTAIAAQLALESQFLYVKMISAEMFVGNPDFDKVKEIVKIFEDAYKSNMSLIILDDIERLIEYISIGSRFSNILLQALLTLVKKKPPNPERKMMIIGTTSQQYVLEQLEIVSCFNVVKTVGTLHISDEVCTILNNFQVANDEMSQIAQLFD